MDWREEVQIINDELEIALDRGMTEAEIAEVMYGAATRLKFVAQAELGEFEPEATGNAV